METCELPSMVVEQGENDLALRLALAAGLASGGSCYLREGQQALEDAWHACQMPIAGCEPKCSIAWVAFSSGREKRSAQRL